MSLDRYILDANGQPVLEPDWEKWAKSKSCGSSIKVTTLAGVRISTIFLGLDHNHCGGEPILWETMVFGGKLNQWQGRNHTREQALATHYKTVLAVFYSLSWWRRMLALFWGDMKPKP